MPKNVGSRQIRSSGQADALLRGQRALHRGSNGRIVGQSKIYCLIQRQWTVRRFNRTLRQTNRLREHKNSHPKHNQISECPSSREFQFFHLIQQGIAGRQQNWTQRQFFDHSLVSAECAAITSQSRRRTRPCGPPAYHSPLAPGHKPDAFQGPPRDCVQRAAP